MRYFIRFTLFLPLRFAIFVGGYEQERPEIPPISRAGMNDLIDSLGPLGVRGDTIAFSKVLWLKASSELL
ncbi:hypothetical protein EUGRSUZ_I00086 [Eucalyptus grandis]|uniref:Uncharacterized protein n=2 Tax=Eucalyptus grandis TaxID=71139 RepID=A0ACC3JAM4_EUCGR|nr:hypothetical protein EUGRSUZ_I00086 [Eucalyptus grandis]